MGEVYKARDTRLDRIVAIKLLPEAFVNDDDRQARFEREARAVAALNHPHICGLYDIGEVAEDGSRSSSGRIRFLVMEYIEGQTLADRLMKGPLTIPEVLRYAVQLADALDHAHRRGLVHRDLKPGNVMLTGTGPKILDFGLCKLQPAPDVPALSTVTSGDAPLTTEAALLGTYPYIAPEQLAGGEADRRSDLFAFGAVVYEMVTGHRPFDGVTTAAVIGAVLHMDPPPMTTIQPQTPPALDRIVSRCLAKDPDDRWQTARDLMLELKSTAEGHAPRINNRQPRTRSIVVPVAALALVVAAVVAFSGWFGRITPADRTTIQLAFSPPDGLTLADLVIGGPVTISPDGERLAFVGTGRDGRQLLWVRSLHSRSAQALPGTDGARYPFWSPDSQSLGFFSQRKLRKIQLAGGTPQSLCDAVLPRGGTWNRDGVILFSAGAGRQLYRVSAEAGIATALPADGMNRERYWPSFLPDGHHFVYFGRPQRYGIYVDAIDSPNAKLLLSDYVGVLYSPPGYLLVLRGPSRGAPAGALLAQPFDPARLQIMGDATPVAEPVRYESGLARGAFSVSENGTLVYGDIHNSTTQLIWFDRAGRALRSVGGPDYGQPSLSPDEKMVAAEHVDPATQDQDIWLIDTTRNVPSRLTSHPNNITFMPVWSADGSRIVYASARDAPPNLYQQSLGIGREELLVRSASNNQPTDWSRDGSFVLFADLSPKTQWDLWLLPVADAETERKAIPVVQTEFNEHLGRFSPDGRWIAYASDESGRDEVYVQAFPTSRTKRRISGDGGNEPRWRGDGRELFYLAPDGTLMAATVKPEADLEVSSPTPLFKIRVGPTRNSGYDVNYTVSRDGQRFLVSTLVEDAKSAASTTVVLNWPMPLGRK